MRCDFKSSLEKQKSEVAKKIDRINARLADYETRTMTMPTQVSRGL